MKSKSAVVVCRGEQREGRESAPEILSERFNFFWHFAKSLSSEFSLIEARGPISRERV